MEHEKLKQLSEESKQALEKAKLEVEVLKLNLMKEGKQPGSGEEQEGRVSLVGGLEEVPVKILRDTGSMDSFILASVLPFSSQSHTEELGKEQRIDSSLDELFQGAVTPIELGNMSRGYCVRDGVLLRKWIPHKDFVGDPVYQVVVPVKFRQMVIEIAHDKAGHQGLDKDWEEGLPYVLGFKSKLIQARELAKLNLARRQQTMKRLYDRTIEHRIFEPALTSKITESESITHDAAWVNKEEMVG
ncbi:Retrovirus-related Pol poly from transposon [Labeo rohita]|uniref:Retrovirus-related Pol poly from transposon n=1 Tax=Labeo rohita TaxID=84645 RepID=A0A498MCI9_LABRO|nr:Retrovirus-related Pol poly from transposon [Labeo rohita]